MFHGVMVSILLSLRLGRCSSACSVCFGFVSCVERFCGGDINGMDGWKKYLFTTWTTAE